MKRLDNTHGVSIIAAVFIIVILAFMGVVFVSLIGTSSLSSVNDLMASQALYAAEAGVEYAIETGTFCNYNYPNIPLTSSQGFSTVSQQASGTMSGAIDGVTDPVNVTLTAPPAGFVIPGAITIGSEYLFCTGVAGNSLTNCKRAVGGSVIAAHNGANVSQCTITSTGSSGSAQRIVRAWASGGAGGGIAFDAAQSNGGRDVATLSWSHTVAGTDRLLIVGVSMRNNTAQTVSGVTYAGVPLTRLGFINNGNNIRVEIWSLVAPATGINNVIVNFSAATRVFAGSMSFTGVDQSTPIDAAAVFNTGNSGLPSVTISTITNNAWVVDVLAAETDVNATMAPAPGRVERWNNRSPGNNPRVRGAGSSLGPITPPGNVTMNWTLASNQRWAIGAVALRPAPTGASVISWQEVVR